MLPPLAAMLLCLVPGALLPAPGHLPLGAPQDSREADEQYRFVAGLAEKGMHDLLVREARAFLQRWPKHPRAELLRYRLAEGLYALGNLEEALAEFRPLAARKGFEHATEAAFRAGQCELAAERLEPAAKAFAEVASSGGYLAPAGTFFLAESRFRQGRFAEAESSYQAVLTDPEGAKTYGREARYGLAWCAARQGRHDSAIERAAAFESAHPRDELAGELRVLAAEAHMGAGRPEAALTIFRTVSAGPALEAALRGAAAALASLSKHAESGRALEELLARFPESESAPEDALQRGVAWLRAGDPARALAALADPRVGTGGEAQAWRAHAHLRAGDAEAALRLAESALQQLPEGDLRARLATVRAESLAKLGRSEEAARAYEQSGTPEARLSAAITALNAGEHAEARRLADGLLRGGAGEPAALLVRGEALLALGELKAAEADFAKLLGAGAEASQEARARERVAWCLHLQAEHAGAAQAFAEVIARHPAAPEAEEARWMLGHSRALGGDPEGARKAWSDYLDKHPKGRHRHAARLELARSGDEAGALGALEALVREKPPAEVEAPALLLLAERLARAGRLKDARARYQQLLERHGTSAEAPAARYGLGHGLHAAGQHVEAAAALATAAEGAAPGSALRASALELRVWALAQGGAAAAEQAAAWRAFAAEAQADDARRLAAWKAVLAGVRKGEAAAAEALLDELFERLTDPDVAVDALVELVWLSLDGARLDAAEAALRSAHKLRGSRAQGAEALAEATFFVGEARYAAGEPARAIELYALAETLAQGELRARALYKRGFACMGTGDSAGARAAFASLVERHQGSDLYGETLYLLGDALLQAGELDAAAETLGRVAREVPKHAVALKARMREGVALGRLERWREAEAALAEVARRAGSKPFEGLAESELWRGRALAALGDARSARAAFDRALALDKGAVAALARLELGRAARAAGDEEAALAEFLKVALLYERGAETAEALLESGRSLERMGDLERARARYAELVEGQPDSAFAAQARERLRALKR